MNADMSEPACQVVGCREPASAVPVEAELASGLQLEVAVCPKHVPDVAEGFVVLGDLEREHLEVQQWAVA